MTAISGVSLRFNWFSPATRCVDCHSCASA
jgi:hypothetical protein